MVAMVTLESLGPRVCILGPSGSGKSTLAAAIARTRGLHAIHLDQLGHLPNTQWQVRPHDEFKAMHDEAVLADHWVMDGNYSRCLPQRLERATGVIRLDISTSKSLLRYFRRCLFERSRVGGLAGAHDRIGWVMLHHIVITSRRSRGRNEAQFAAVTLPKIRLATPGAITEFYDREGLACLGDLGRG